MFTFVFIVLAMLRGGGLISLIIHIIFYNIPGQTREFGSLNGGSPQRLTGWWHQFGGITGVPGFAVQHVAHVSLAGGSSSTSQLGSPR